jgi:hypothetical protein
VEKNYHLDAAPSTHVAKDRFPPIPNLVRFQGILGPLAAGIKLPVWVVITGKRELEKGYIHVVALLALRTSPSPTPFLVTPSHLASVIKIEVKRKIS